MVLASARKLAGMVAVRQAWTQPSSPVSAVSPAFYQSFGLRKDAGLSATVCHLLVLQVSQQEPAISEKHFQPPPPRRLVWPALEPAPGGAGRLLFSVAWSSDAPEAAL